MGGHSSREGKRSKWVSVNCCVAVMGFQGRNKVGPFDPRGSADFATVVICNNCLIERSKSILFWGFGEATTTGEGWQQRRCGAGGDWWGWWFRGFWRSSSSNIFFTFFNKKSYV